MLLSNVTVTPPKLTLYTMFFEWTLFHKRTGKLMICKLASESVPTSLSVPGKIMMTSLMELINIILSGTS